MTSDQRLVSILSQRRLAELIEAAPVLQAAGRLVGQQAKMEEGHSLQRALAHLRAQAPVTLLQAMEAPRPAPELLEALGRALYAALELAWITEVHTVADRPF
jgi:hypothetical protein